MSRNFGLKRSVSTHERTIFVFLGFAGVAFVVAIAGALAVASILFDPPLIF